MARRIRDKPKVLESAEPRTPLRGIAAILELGWRWVLMRDEQGYTLTPAELAAVIKRCRGVPGYAAEYVAGWVERTAGPKRRRGRPRLSQSDPGRHAEDERLENDVRWLQAALRLHGVAAHRTSALRIVAKREGVMPTSLRDRLKRSLNLRDSGLHRLPSVDSYGWSLGVLEEAGLVRLDQSKGVVSVRGNQIIRPELGLDLLFQLLRQTDPFEVC